MDRSGHFQKWKMSTFQKQNFEIDLIKIKETKGQRMTGGSHEGPHVSGRKRAKMRGFNRARGDSNPGRLGGSGATRPAGLAHAADRRGSRCLLYQVCEAAGSDDGGLAGGAPVTSRHGGWVNRTYSRTCTRRTHARDTKGTGGSPATRFHGGRLGLTRHTMREHAIEGERGMGRFACSPRSRWCDQTDEWWTELNTPALEQLRWPEGRRGRRRAD